jgi:hypothetical protein
MKNRFDELLPFYVNGTLNDEDKQWVDAYLQDHPAAKAELGWARSLQSRLHEDVPAVSSEVGLDRAMHRIRTEGPAPERARQAAKPSFFEQARSWLASIVPQPALRPVLAGALAVVALQAVVIVHMAGQADDDAGQMRTIPSKVADPGPFLKVNFKGDARETDIRFLLVEVNGSLAAGPGQLGDYYVRIPVKQIDALAAKVRASAIVDAVAVVDGLPARQ